MLRFEVLFFKGVDFVELLLKLLYLIILDPYLLLKLIEFHFIKKILLLGFLYFLLDFP